MRPIIERLRILFLDGKITIDKLEIMRLQEKITQDEFEYITKESL